MFLTTFCVFLCACNKFCAFSVKVVHFCGNLCNFFAKLLQKYAKSVRKGLRSVQKCAKACENVRKRAKVCKKRAKVVKYSQIYWHLVVKSVINYVIKCDKLGVFVIYSPYVLDGWIDSG